ncbi:MAG: hypothetical protein EBR82_77470 [Caulobacteraceae bacterium]|nr:hypothetical protein [Caulobacteraceae bacterium]
MAALSSIIIGALAAAAAAGTGYSIYAGEQGKKAQEDAMRKQEAAQAQAAKQAQSQARLSRQAMAAANRIEPEFGGIMQAGSKPAGSSARTQFPPRWLKHERIPRRQPQLQERAAA